MHAHSTLDQQYIYTYLVEGLVPNGCPEAGAVQRQRPLLQLTLPLLVDLQCSQTQVKTLPDYHTHFSYHFSLVLGDEVHLVNEAEDFGIR